MSFIQQNDADRVRDFVNACRVQASPTDLGITREDFDRTFQSLKEYVRRESLDFSVIDVANWDSKTLDDAWRFVQGINPVASTDSKH